MTPLAPRKSHRNLILCIICIWLLGILVASPAGLFADLVPVG